MKTLTCSGLEETLRGSEPEARAAMEAHAAQCPACREALRRWNEISEAATSLHREWESPELWSRIRTQLAEESQSDRKERRGIVWPAIQPVTAHWQIIATATALIVLTFFSTRLLWKPHGVNPPITPPAATSSPSAASSTAPEAQQIHAASDKQLLTEQALKEVETAEANYIQALDRLAAEVQPQLQNPTTPLMANYREKLLLIDNAIAECRANIEMNRFNAHLRRQLLTMYQEKHRTLQDILAEETHEQP